MKTKLEITVLIIIIAFLSTVFLSKVYSQEQRGSMTAGNRTFELSYISENEEGLGFGAAFSLVDSGLVEARANKNDTMKNKHEFVSNVTPTVFALISGDFEQITIVGKIGTAYVNQNINGIRDSKKLYFAVGISFEKPITEEISVKAGYDNVNSLLIGVSFKL